jgi:hypothetical protein
MLKNRFFLLFILFLTFNIFVSCSLIKKRTPSPIKQETTTKDSGTDIDDKVIFLQQKEIDLKNLEDFLVEKQKSLTIIQGLTLLLLYYYCPKQLQSDIRYLNYD